MRQRIRHILAASVLSISLTTGANVASAALWNIDAVFSGNNGGGFGFSSFHDASDNSPMSGSGLGNITGVTSGTYNDMTGVLMGTFNLNGPGGPTFDLSSLNGMFFGGAGFVFGFLEAPVRNVNVDFDGALTVEGVSRSSTTISFEPGDVCCTNGSNNDLANGDPNSFIRDLVNGGAIMSLWGADGYDGGYTGGLPYGTWGKTLIGMDLRFHLSLDPGNMNPVPIPAALPLFAGGLGIMGFLGWRRRSRRTAA